MNKDKMLGYAKELLPYVIIVIVVVLIRTFIATPVRVDGASMDATLTDGQILILNKYDKSFDRFDIVVINNNGKKIIKRIIGLPGEYIAYKDDKLYIGKGVGEDILEVTDAVEGITEDFTLEELYGYTMIPDGYYFVMGDNRMNSSDSRDTRIGLINKSTILGTTTYRIFPFSKFGKIN